MVRSSNQAGVQISLQTRWLFGNTRKEEIDPTLFALLEAVATEGSLTRAAESLAVSYRYAWGLVKKWQARFSSPLLVTQRGRGRGARLTDFGERLMSLRRELDSAIGERLDLAGADVSRELGKFIERPGREVIRIAASHGMAVGHLVDILRQGAEREVRLQTRGSLESLRMLSRLECSAAGFHLPLGRMGRQLFPLYERWLRADGFQLILVATRRQGIMTQPSNAKRISKLDDLTKRSVRFVNRQPESGTRTIFDALLKEQDVDARRIRGYEVEEFTHVAVAAMVASGAADAGFGIQAAAAEFRLHFIPLVREAYLVALPADAHELRKAFQTALRSSRFRQYVAALPGYDARRSGRIFTVAEVLALS